MKNSFRHALLLVAAVAAVAAGCENPASEGEPRKEPGFRVIAGAGVDDSVDARPVQALAVELIGDDGRPRAGVPVRFEASMVTGSWGLTPSVHVSEVETDAFRDAVTDTTDAQGRAYARVKLGTVAGPGSVVAAVPTLGLQTTAGYTIRPGRTRVAAGRDAAISPDGTRMAYIINDSTLVISTLATGATVTIPGAAASPRWSPAGDEIAYLGVTESYWPVGELRAVRPDGTGPRSLTASGTIYRAYFDYSPDGIIASSRNAVPTVAEIATGREVLVSLPQLDHGLLAPS